MKSARKAHVLVSPLEVAPGVLASSASPRPGLPLSPSERSQHAGIGCGGTPIQDSHRLSPLRHLRGWKPLAHSFPASAFLPPLAPRALPRFLATLGALTPAQGALRTPTSDSEHPPYPRQVSMVHMALDFLFVSPKVTHTRFLALHFMHNAQVLCRWIRESAHYTLAKNLRHLWYGKSH